MRVNWRHIKTNSLWRVGIKVWLGAGCDQTVRSQPSSSWSEAKEARFLPPALLVSVVSAMSPNRYQSPTTHRCEVFDHPSALSYQTRVDSVSAKMAQSSRSKPTDGDQVYDFPGVLSSPVQEIRHTAAQVVAFAAPEPSETLAGARYRVAIERCGPQSSTESKQSILEAQRDTYARNYR